MIPFVMPTYGRADLAFERGEGAWLFTESGAKYLDFGSGVAVTALGHCHPHLVAALTEQAGRLWHCSNLYRVPGQERLAERLVGESFADTAFFCNSGAEATEGAIKVARKHFHAKGQPERNRVIVAENAFHGRTLAGISAGGQAKHTTGFAPLLDGFDRVPFGNLNALRSAIGPATCAIMVEPVQGEGGARPAPEGYLRGLRRAADEYGILLIHDEVQTGMGRTGHLFAHQCEDGAAPDIMALAKGLGGGFPVGAVLATADAAVGMQPGTHGSTFGGNPLAMAAANAVLDVMLEPGFLERSRRMAGLLHARCAALVTRHPKHLVEVRGQGLLMGLKAADSLPNTDIGALAMKKGLLVVGAGDNVVRLLPPLTVSEAEIEQAVSILDETLVDLTDGL